MGSETGLNKKLGISSTSWVDLVVGERRVAASLGPTSVPAEDHAARQFRREALQGGVDVDVCVQRQDGEARI